MRVNQDDVTGSGKLTAPCSIRTTLTCRCPTIGGHVRTTGRTLDYQHVVRAADRSDSKWFVIKWMGVLGYGGTGAPLHRQGAITEDRVGPSLVRGRELRKKK